MGDLEQLERERGNIEYMDVANAGSLQNNEAWKKRMENGRMDDAGTETALSAVGSNGRTASDEMCTFLVMNISSLQLIPVNIIAYRSQYGSINPSAVIAPAIVATAVSTGVAVVWCKIMCKQQRV